MLAYQAMSRPVHTIPHSETVEHAAMLLSRWGVAAAPVLDDHNALVGMIRRTDLRPPAESTEPPAPAASGRHHADWTRRHVTQVMIPRVVTAATHTDLAQVAQALLDPEVPNVSVLDGGELVGIISARDILHAMVRTDDVVRREVQWRLDEYAGRRGRWLATVEAGAVTVVGPFDDPRQRQVVAALARSVPGVAGLSFGPPPGERTDCG